MVSLAETYYPQGYVCTVAYRDEGKRVRAYSWFQDKGKDFHFRGSIIDSGGFVRSFGLVVALVSTAISVQQARIRIFSCQISVHVWNGRIA